MEIIDIVNEQGEPIGETADRTVIHEQGLLHRTSHVWLARMRAGVPQILLQRRSMDKDSYPGCYDISSAGHIPAGADFEESAMRELEEELGVYSKKEDLVYCGTRRIQYEDFFHGKVFKDNQISKVFVLWFDQEEEAFQLQIEELDEVIWMDFDVVLYGVQRKTLKSCIMEEELFMIEKEVKKNII